MIRKVLANARPANPVQYAGIGAAVAKMMDQLYMVPPIAEEFIARQRLCVDQLELLRTLERRTRTLQLFTDAQIDLIIGPLFDMMEAEFNLLLAMDRNRLISFEAQRWDEAVLWSEKAELYESLVRRSSLLLRSCLLSIESDAGPAFNCSLDVYNLLLRTIFDKKLFMMVPTPATWFARSSLI